MRFLQQSDDRVAKRTHTLFIYWGNTAGQSIRRIHLLEAAEADGA